MKTKNLKKIHIQITKIVLVFIIPLLFTLHGLIYNSTGVSSSGIVYSIKLATFLSIVPLIKAYGLYVFKDIQINALKNIFILIVFFNIISSLINVKNISFFYFFADLAGLSITFIYIFYLLYIFKHQNLLFFKILNYCFKSAVFISLGIIVNYLISNGNKVSIPPELHYIISLTFVSILIGFKKEIFMKIVFISILIIGIMTSQLRINLLLMILSVSFGLYWVFRYKKLKNSLLYFLIVTFIAIIIISSFQEILLSRLESLQFTEINSNNILVDNSANQRVLEVLAILDTIKDSNFFLLIFGHGFGATYNDMMNLIPHYPLTMHNSHVAYFSIFFRNGLLGLIIFITPLIYSLKFIFMKSQISFVFCVAIFLTYIALIFDQYVYWGFYFALSVSAILGLNHHSHKELNEVLKN